MNIAIRKESPAIPRATKSRRRQLGRYDTPRPLSQAIADWAIRSATDTALEPSSGSGVFVQSFAHRLVELGTTNAKKQLWACDIDALACGETKKNGNLPPDHLWNEDFLSLVTSDGIKGRKFDCVGGNPPYVSLHRMPLAQRNRALEAVKRLDLQVGGRASLWAYFLAASVHVLSQNGRLAFILPESALHAEYALDLIRSTAKFFHKCTLISIRERCFLSDGADERVVIILADGFAEMERATDIELHESITASEAIHFIGTLRNDSRQSLPILNGHAVPHLLPKCDSLVDIAKAPNSQLFGDFAIVRIGVVTGADHFFVLADEERRKWKLRRAWLTHLLPKFQECKGFAFLKTDWEQVRKKGKKCWLLSPPKTQTTKPAALNNYLKRFLVQNRKTNKTFAKRKLWFAPDLGKKPHAFFRYMGATGPRIAFSRFNSTCTNTVHRIYFNAEVSPLMRKAIILSLHSSFSQLSAEFEGRAYGSGVLKLEPSEVRRIKFLLPPHLQKKTVEKCFDRADTFLRRGDIAAAVAAIDDWLYEEIPTLEQSVPRTALKALLNLSIQRRLGYPKHFATAANCKNELAN